MNSMRKIICLITAVVVTAFALPAYAATKSFNITVPAGPLAGGAQSLAVKFTSLAGGAPNSLELDVQSGPLVITSATVLGGINGNVFNGGKSVQFVGLTAIKTSITVTVNATVTINGCDPAGVQWFAHMWAGSPSSPSSTLLFVDGSGNQIPPAAYPVTTFINQCNLAFLSQPANALANTTITSVADNPSGTPPVQVVRYVNSQLDTSFAGPLSLAKSADSDAGGLTGTTPTFSGGVASFAPMISAAGNYKLVATSGSVSTTSNQFTIFGGTYPLDCINSPNGGVNTFGDAKVQGFRAGNKDGSQCKLVDWTLTDNILLTNTNEVHYVWDTGLQTGGVFDYTVHWNPVYVDPATGMPKPTQVAWNLVGPPAYVNARMCLSPDLPAPYGTVTTQNIAASTSGSANETVYLAASTALPTPPYAIVIDQEGMEVTADDGGSPHKLTVTRGRGIIPVGTAVPMHQVNANVMSTGLPLDGAGKLMQMCILSQKVEILSPGQCSSLVNPNAPNPPPACVQIDTELEDNGDGWGSQP